MIIVVTNVIQAILRKIHSALFVMGWNRLVVFIVVFLELFIYFLLLSLQVLFLSLFCSFSHNIMLLLFPVFLFLVSFPQNFVLFFDTLINLNLFSLFFLYPPSLKVHLFLSLSFQFGIVLLLFVIAPLLLIFDIFNQTEYLSWNMLNNSAFIFKLLLLDCVL